MRARMALKTQNIAVELREVLLRDKPPSMLSLSPKGTVPVLQTDDGTVIDESLDIMSWALPDASPWFALSSPTEQIQLAKTFDVDFKPHLDAYKYHRGEDPYSPEHHRDLAAACLDDFEQRLGGCKFLLGDAPQFFDLAAMPFVRQFASVNRQWFDRQPRQRVRQWLDEWLKDPLFIGVMAKHPQWQEGSAGVPWP